jgi:hypothetical protein
MERTHQVSRHHTRLIISAQMPMFLLRRVRSRLALLVGWLRSTDRAGVGGTADMPRTHRACWSDVIGTKLPMRHVGSSVANGGKADEICSG